MTDLNLGLTRRQKAVYDAARRFADKRGYMPSIAELAGELGLAKSTVHLRTGAMIEGRRAADDSSGVCPNRLPAAAASDRRHG